MGLPLEAPVVAVFARLNRLKGIEYFLQAAALLAARFEDARFLIVGDSISEAYRKELETLAASLGLGDRVVFSGFRSDVAELLSEVTVSVLPSLAEGLSNVVLEAMAAGVPIVATQVGGTPELVEDGVTGIMVPPRDAVALAQAIGSLLADPLWGRTMGERARGRVGEHFSLEAAVRNTEQLYERLLVRARDRAPALEGGQEGDARLSPPDSPYGDKEWR
ncbi:MAG: glycosyltransferase [Vicinamibacteria bacterium]|nr:glycosyltransferase [Vicinamibacteria bacterium]